MCDLFRSEDVRRVLSGKHVVLLGDSNIRGIYKDIIWLMNDNSFIPYECLSAKGENRFPDFNNWKSGNKKISSRIRKLFNDQNRDHRVHFNGLHSGRSYIEPRHYYRKEDDIHLHFIFITRVWSKDLEDWISTFPDRNDGAQIDVLLMSSCLWDFNRWGPFGVTEYKENLNKLLKKVKECLPPNSHFVWLTSLPTSKELNSKAMRVPGLEFQCLTSRYNVVESNFYTAHKVNDFGYHVIDMHYYSLLQSYRRLHDGIHWSPEANRLFTSLILTYLCLIFKEDLPGRVRNNVSLEKIKLMAKVAQGSAEELSPREVQQKLEELNSLADKLTPKAQQILNELKQANLGPLPSKQQQQQKKARGNNRSHPYNNGKRGRGGRGGVPIRNVGNNRPDSYEGFGPILENRPRVPVWQQQPWGLGPGIDPTQRDSWCSGSMEPNLQNPWGNGSKPNLQNPWGSGPESGPRNPWGPGLNPNQQCEPAWQCNLDPIPIFSEFGPQRHQAAKQQRQKRRRRPEVGGRLNYAPDPSFINPMYRHVLSGGNSDPFGSNLGGPGSFGGSNGGLGGRDSFGDNSRGSGSFGGGSGSLGPRSFADDDDNCNFGPPADKNSGGSSFSGFPAPHQQHQLPNFDRSMVNNNCFSNNQRFSSIDELQRAQQQQSQFGPGGWSRGNNF